MCHAAPLVHIGAHAKNSRIAPLLFGDMAGQNASGWLWTIRGVRAMAGQSKPAVVEAAHVARGISAR